MNAAPESEPAVGPVQAPHAPLPAYYQDEAEHQRFLRRIFDETASDYDRIERVLALGTGSRYRRMALQRAGLTGKDVDLMIPHQANIRIIEATAKHAEIPMSKVMVSVDRYGNTSSASIPLAIEQALADGRIRRGSLLLLVAFGAGFTWGSMVVRW